MTTPLFFDGSLETFVRTLVANLGQTVVEQGFVLRDASGHLGFIANELIDEPTRGAAIHALQSSMSAYCRAHCVLDIRQPGVSSLVADAQPFRQTVRIDGSEVGINMLDRRIVGHDWLSPPAPGWKDGEPARFVFASLKGGVGRSTALAVLAADLARQGGKVLVIDLDLEAPGIGAMLLDEDDQPKYGVLDWMVERGIYGDKFDDSAFLLDMQKTSPFGHGRGLIHVVPAVGSVSDLHPENVLAKIARAYLELPQESGAALSFLDQAGELVKRLSTIAAYNVILIDARAGLNETTAAAMLGLGADVLLFGIDTPQTFASYRYLLSHLARFPRKPEDDWLYRLHMVHAKARPNADQRTAFRDRSYAMFREFLYRDVPMQDDSGNPAPDLLPLEEFGLTDHNAPHHAWAVLADGNYNEFDPRSKGDQLSQEYYQLTFSGLLEGVAQVLPKSEGEA